MFDTEPWVVLDTETTGLRRPIYPVEIAAQRMVGWQTHGDPFRMLVNFDVPIEPAAQQVHGYSREYLRANGHEPHETMHAFLAYVDGAPIVAYNVDYDCGAVLAPTLLRMAIHAKLTPGFCALNLARRLAPMLPNFKLKTLVTTFGISKGQDHDALGDVVLVVRFLAECVAPHLAQQGIAGIEQVAACAAGTIRVPPLHTPAK